MATRILNAVASDVRFPTSRTLAGSDAMNRDPDYSAAYVILETDDPGGLSGHGLTFTTGRGTELCVEAVRLLANHVVGLTMEDIAADMAGFWRGLVGDSQLRWLGPEKGVVHLATAALVNAVWDLYARLEHKPLWKLLVDMSPQQLVDCVKIKQLAEEAIGEGFTHLKLKVGFDAESDLRRARALRDALGPNGALMLDANQVWGVEEAISYMRPLAEVDPWWIEEPTSPDDVLGHRRIRDAIRPIKVATGEHVQNRIVFKQLLQAEAIDFCQIDSCRLGGVNEVIAVLLLASKFGVPVCPHAGGVGLCEYVRHLSIFDYIAVSASLENRVCEFVDHLHEHFVDPAVVAGGRYVCPTKPGYSAEMKRDSLSTYSFPGGPAWA